MNTDARWDEFDPLDYVWRNYRTVLDVDAHIMSLVRTHFTDHFRRFPGRRVRGIDVGAGANLYPSLLMLPWCDEITLLDRSRPNVEYLRRQLAGDACDSGWDAFWSELRTDDAYAGVPGGPWAALSRIARVERGNLFHLLGRAAQWQLGTMFFVAESISGSPAEFDRSLECFFGSLQPGAPFAAAFMEHSTGYEVGGLAFPAYDVSESQITAGVARHAREGDLRIHRIGKPEEVRPGYASMILACGFRGGGNP
ncbi:SCO2525 family SAM-dependent methyltransferase [Streptomyces sp. NPDC004065]|uniref:SCO2525 family SAM-dependent methyltransferase n=1 Tax=Streptomyces sp. NPDC004065 TaxID=3364689 RepID=UPI00384FBE78